MASLKFGDYRLIRRLGSGGMAEVFLAKRVGARGFEKQLVIKRILPHLAKDPRMTELFLREARYAALIDHPNLVHVSDFGELDGSFFLAMERVDGITISELLSYLDRMTPGVASRIAMEVCAALQAIHTARDEAGQRLELVHRDVTPRNVMVTRDGGVKLLDFGIALPRTETALPATGTARHMSPEQIRGDPQDHRSDIFALGVLLHEMLTGEPPFDHEMKTLSSRLDDLPKPLIDLVGPMLSLTPDDRPASAREIQSQLELYVGSRGIEGTRAHLGELVSQFLSPPRALSRITQRTMTRILQFTGIPGKPATDAHETRGHTGEAEARIDRGRARPRLAVMAMSLVSMLLGIGIASLIASRDAGDATESADRVAPSRSPVEPQAPKPPEDIAASTSSESVATEPNPIAQEAIPTTGTVLSRHPSDVEEDTHATKRTKREPEHRNLIRSRAVMGSLTVDTQPWSEVYLDGKKLGLTPLQGVRLPRGRHDLELRNPSTSRRIRVEIRPGKETRIQLAL